MAARFSCKSVSIDASGTSFAHSLTPSGSSTATAPDEWAVNGVDVGASTNGVPYVVGSPDASGITVASTSGTITADVFAWIDHSLVD